MICSVPVLFASSDGLFLRMLDGNFAGFQEHKESLNVNGSLKSNGWNLEPKFNTYLCDIEMGGSSARSSVSSRHYQETQIQKSVIQEEPEDEIEPQESPQGSVAPARKLGTANNGMYEHKKCYGLFFIREILS